MRVLLVILLIILGLSNKEKEMVVTAKKIIVTGQTSLGGFKCDYSKNGLKDTLYIDNQLHAKELVFDIQVQNFSCGNFLLNKDFRKTIKADEFPKAEVRVRNLKSNSGGYYCDLYVDLVGKKITHQKLPLQKTKEGLKANLILSFGELDLDPPKKLGGLVKVEEQLALEIALTI